MRYYSLVANVHPAQCHLTSSLYNFDPSELCFLLLMFLFARTTESGKEARRSTKVWLSSTRALLA